MNVALKIAAAAAALVGAGLASGCGAQTASTPSVTIQGCADYGARAIRHHVTVTSVPAACRGLSKAGINESVGRAIHLVAGGWRKSVSRKLAGLAEPAWVGWSLLPGPRRALFRPASRSQLPFAARAWM
jgi:hypothetical protein